MKIGAFILLLVLSSSEILRADATFWNNGIASPQSIGNDTRGTGTGPGYTVYDDFTVPNNVTTITGLSYTDILNYGSWSDYVSTNWSLFFNANDPFGVPLYSGTAVFTMTPPRRKRPNVVFYHRPEHPSLIRPLACRVPKQFFK